MEIKEILHKFLSKGWFRNGIRSLLRRADTRGNADIIAVYVTNIASLWVRHVDYKKYATHRIFNTNG